VAFQKLIQIKTYRRRTWRWFSQALAPGQESMDPAVLASLLVVARNNHHQSLGHAMHPSQMTWPRDEAHLLFCVEERMIFFPALI